MGVGEWGGSWGVRVGLGSEVWGGGWGVRVGVGE